MNKDKFECQQVADPFGTPEDSPRERFSPGKLLEIPFNMVGEQRKLGFYFIRC